jgi:hypothetical protein
MTVCVDVEIARYEGSRGNKEARENRLLIFIRTTSEPGGGGSHL